MKENPHIPETLGMKAHFSHAAMLLSDMNVVEIAESPYTQKHEDKIEGVLAAILKDIDPRNPYRDRVETIVREQLFYLLRTAQQQGHYDTPIEKIWEKWMAKTEELLMCVRAASMGEPIPETYSRLDLPG